ncbi:MAG: NADPH-dependent 7-cyano-7-deazaguanine reductase QueF, partial [Herbaspirillum sp.]|nr:NADPH-dependent 7-cyano-7-deazaguanine reductase QueF [Herbaspirillum sp.]
MDQTTPPASTAGHSPESSPLGKSSEYPTHYDPSLLFPIPRAPKRAELQISGTLPFFGADFWTAYEISW